MVTLMPRARWIFDQNALAIGAGISEGPVWWSATPLDSPDDPKTWTAAWRTELEISFEHRASSGFTIRPYVGLTGILNRADGVCRGIYYHSCTPEDPGPLFSLFYSGLALGYAF